MLTCIERLYEWYLWILSNNIFKRIILFDYSQQAGRTKSFAVMQY